MLERIGLPPRTGIAGQRRALPRASLAASHRRADDRAPPFETRSRRCPFRERRPRWPRSPTSPSARSRFTACTFQRGQRLDQGHTLEAVRTGLQLAPSMARVVCGDLNTPRRKLESGEVVSLARDSRGRLRPERGPSGTRPSSVVVPGLRDLGYRDAYCSLHGYRSGEPSWTWQRISGHGGGWRLDQLFTSAELRPAACIYHHAWRDEGLSDHSALEADIVPGEWGSASAGQAVRHSPDSLGNALKRLDGLCDRLHRFLELLHAIEPLSRRGNVARRTRSESARSLATAVRSWPPLISSCVWSSSTSPVRRSSRPPDSIVRAVEFSSA